VLLEFIAEHRLALRDHVRALLGVSPATASRLLRGLERAALVHRDPLFRGYPAHFRIARRGLAAIGSDLPAPKRDLEVRHDIGVAWLWLAARRGAFGPLHEVVSERRMRSRDGREQHAERVTGRREHPPFGIRLSGLGAGGRSRLHYPDLLLVDGGGRRIAVELELSSKGRARRHRIIGGYAADRRIDAVLYLVGDERIARQIQDAARRFGCRERVLVQPARLAAGQAPELGGADRPPPIRRPERGMAR
jgi:DNA-binding transcriptional ArsR family regulator